MNKIILGITSIGAAVLGGLLLREKKYSKGLEGHIELLEKDLDEISKINQERKAELEKTVEKVNSLEKEIGEIKEELEKGSMDEPTPREEEK